MTSDGKKETTKKDTPLAADDQVFHFDAEVGGETVDLNTPGLRVRATKLSKKEMAEAERRFTARL